jgi:hypothetical protein
VVAEDPKLHSISSSRISEHSTPTTDDIIWKAPQPSRPLLQDAPGCPGSFKLRTSEEGGPPVKRVKQGFRAPMSPKICGVAFESVPAWLWVARLSDFSQIYVSDPDSQRLLKEFATTWEQFKDKLRIIENVGWINIEVDVWFLSGSRCFLQRMAPRIPALTPMVSWLYPAGRRKPPDQTLGSRWISICHSQVGGPTNITGMFGLKNLPSFQVEKDPISRTIGHIIKYAERPTPCTPDVDPRLHYCLSDRLSEHHLGRPVLLATSFSRTGWGRRKLIPTELGHAYDLPPYVHWEGSFRTTLVPLHLLRTLMDHALSSVEDTSVDSTDVMPQDGPCHLMLVNSVTPPDEVFLASIQKWLPGSWADAPIASKAVKADNARIDFSPWNRRITLVLPCSSLDIERIEEFAMRIWRRRLVASFRQYLVGRYGPNWQQREWVYRGAAPRVGSRRSAAVASVADDPPPWAKCSRIMGAGCQEGGGKVNVSDMRSIRTERNGVGDITNLIQDVDSGRAVLQQVLSGSWWDWSNGSSLIFWRWNGPEQIQAARDGMGIFIKSPLPRGRRLKQSIRGKGVRSR